MSRSEGVPAAFCPPVRRWFERSFDKPTGAQAKAFGPITRGESVLVLAPTGSGKTLAAFLSALNTLMFSPEPESDARCRVLYVSPLKALTVDIERNLRAPLAGIAREAEEMGVPFRVPSVGVRSGDTPAKERAAMSRRPPDILITTPESLYLLLTSAASEMLRSVRTVIVDEIHSLVPTKRGAHLFLSLERLEAQKRSPEPLQRIGLSATQRPLDEVARLLGGLEAAEPGQKATPRAVTIVDAGRKKAMEISVEVPLEDMSRIGEEEVLPSGPASAAPPRKSIWPSIHPRLVELIRAHRSTMIFANSRRLSERLASAINELAGEEIALAHHGSVAKDKRQEIEERLKNGQIPAIVATSSLELGIDMGAVDLVIQIEAPPSVASGMQRIGRANHSVGKSSRGIMFPKYRGDLLPCAAAVASMKQGEVEETYYPRSPLDVLAQQVVAILAMSPMTVSALYDLVRRAAPFAELPLSSFEGVLDMLSGRYPSDEFAGLRPRITWDRIQGMVKAREGAQRIAIVNGGTIPDRGLYGVFMVDGGDKRRRVGELDEEMVFESRVGDVFLLGASSWRIEDISHDRVMVSPAPGTPGKMPFWHGDRPGRPIAFGVAVGKMGRDLVAATDSEARARLRDELGFDEKAASNVLSYLAEQKQATVELPSDKLVVIERSVDEMGDHRVCVLSPFGGRVHAPWATAIGALCRQRLNMEADVSWTDDGMIFRFPEADSVPEASLFFPTHDDVEQLVIQNVGTSPLFATHFRENAARALLLPRRHPTKRSPLWAQRKRASDLLAVASNYPSFPIVLETYRQCLRDVFDLPALVELLRNIELRKVRVSVIDSKSPSPFARTLLFNYVANFIYDGDAPLAERRAQALAVDPVQLRELLGEGEMRTLLDPDAIEDIENALQNVDASYRIKHADGLHDMLLKLGDLSREELRARSQEGLDLVALRKQLIAERRILPLKLGNPLYKRYIAIEDAGRYRDALGYSPPSGTPLAFLEAKPSPLIDLVSRFARTHGPFRVRDVGRRWGIGVAPLEQALSMLVAKGRLVKGEFLPHGLGEEYCDSEVLASIKRRSLAKLRKEVEPTSQQAFVRFLVEWQGVAHPRAGLDGLLSVIEQLQGIALPASVLENEILPARVLGYRSSDLDTLCSAGEVLWRGFEPIGAHDGRIALYLTDQYRLLAQPPSGEMSALATRLFGLFEQRGALFFADLVQQTGLFVHDLVEGLWELLWNGHVTNDTLSPLRSQRAGKPSKKPRPLPAGMRFRSRRIAPPGTEGRWTLLPSLTHAHGPSDTERSSALAHLLLERYGIVTRESAQAEGVLGGFARLYQILKPMEELGRVRRGYFIEGLGALQFALPGADDRLRQLRKPSLEPLSMALAATDPANPYGANVPWPTIEGEGARPRRAVGARVFLVDGHLRGYLGPTERDLLTFLPSELGSQMQAAKELVTALGGFVDRSLGRALLLASVDGVAPSSSVLALHWAAGGFTPTSSGMIRRPLSIRSPPHDAVASRSR